MMKGTERVSPRLRAASLVMAILAAPVALPAASAAEDPGSEKTYRLDAVQEEAVRLILLDVRVEGEDGQPLRGLTREDFTLRLDGRLWPVYSSDEICPEARRWPAVSRSLQARDIALERPVETPFPEKGMASPPREPKRFVLYFDFSSLMMDGRLRAHRAALRWVREIHRPGEEVEIAAFSGVAGLRILQSWSSDPAVIRSAVGRAFADRELHDPHPSTIFSRVDECIDCVKAAESACLQCPAYAREDYHHGKRSLIALEHYLAMLGETPGSKVIFLFTQAMTISPGRFYPVRDPDLAIGTHLRLMEKVSAAATEARAAFYPITAGNNQYDDSDPTAVPGMTRASVEFASNLAEFTGGSVSRGPSDTTRALREAGRESACTYRLAFRPPGDDGKRTRTWRAEVRAAGRAVPWIYRVHHLSEADRAMRRARALLAGAARDDSLDVVAALWPLEAGRSRWAVAIQVSVEASSLGRLNPQADQVTHLDVGALLEDEDRGRSWELLGAAEIRRKAGSPGRGVLLYQSVVEHLRPGRYRLRAFVLDASLDQAGRAEAVLGLPHPRGEGITAPIASMPGRTVFATGLPLLHGPETPPGRIIQARRRSAPLGRGEIIRGEPLQMTSWVCSSRGAVERQLIRYIERDGVPIYKIPLGWVDAAGRCSRVTDVFHTIELAPGIYTYRMGWRDDSGAEARHASRPVAFTVTERRDVPAAVARASD